MKQLPLALLLLAAPVAGALADTIKLKTGETLEGTIKEATATDILVEVQFSPTIKDIRRIAKSDIAGISRQTNDEIAFEKIRGIEVPDTALDSTELKATLDEKLKPFITRYGYSTRAGDIKKKIEDFEAAIARIDKGEVKAAGVWYDRASFAQEKYQVDANNLLSKMRAAIAASDYVDALNAFDQLHRTYPNSVAFATSISGANDAIAKFSQQLNFAVGNLPSVLSDRKQTVERTPAGQRSVIEQAMNAEQARADAAAAEAQRTNQRFFAIVPFDEKGLKQMQSNLQMLRSELSAIDAQDMADKATLARRANQELADNEPKAAATTIAELRAAWPEYEGLSRLDQKLRTQEMQMLGNQQKKP